LKQHEGLKTCQSATALLRSNGVEAGREFRMMEREIRKQDGDLSYPRPGELVHGGRDLSHPDDTSQHGNDDEDNDAGAAAQEPDDRGSAPDSSVSHGPTYSQRNIGRTVIANQGTQHVSVGGADE
jgi:hypothetical protein